MLTKRKPYVTKSRGDTLVEVLFATATASLIIVITLVVMNRNLAQIQLGVETTFVRQAIDSQAEVLRYLRDQYMENRSGTSGPPQQWKNLISTSGTGYAQPAATDFGTCQPENGTLTAPAAGRAFYLNNSSNGLSSNKAETDAANIQLIDPRKITNTSVSETYARPGQGLWIESVNRTDFGIKKERFVDFHIRACWEPPFNAPTATLGTIVRLYYEAP